MFNFTSAVISRADLIDYVVVGYSIILFFTGNYFVFSISQEIASHLIETVSACQETPLRLLQYPFQ